MNKTVAVVILSGTLLLSSGCASLFPDIKLSRAEKTGELRLNMSFDEVKKLIGRGPAYGDVYYRSVDFQGEWIYWMLSPGLNFKRTYSFIFLNNRLQSWNTI